MRSLSTESDMAAVVTDGLLIVTLDKQGERVNLLGRAAMRLAHARLDRLEACSDVRALLFVSGKERCFLGGGALNEVSRPGREEGESGAGSSSTFMMSAKRVTDQYGP